MKTTTTILPGVKSIGWVDCDKLQRRVDLHGICGTPIPVLTAIQPIDFFDEPECKCKTVKDANGYTDTATLKFSCGSLLPIHIHLGFVVTDTNDKSYLIGSKEAPYPKLNVELGVGDCDGDGAGFYYEITHVAIKSMVACLP